LASDPDGTCGGRNDARLFQVDANLSTVGLSSEKQKPDPPLTKFRTSCLFSLLKITFSSGGDVSDIGQIETCGVAQLSALKLCGDDINGELHHNQLAVLSQNLIRQVHGQCRQFDTKFMVIRPNLADLIFDRTEVVPGSDLRSEPGPRLQGSLVEVSAENGNSMTKPALENPPRAFADRHPHIR
jgi:hypothetical protein